MRSQYLLGVFTVLLLESVALGDGCYIPERAVRKIPEIPAQRAILSWKDGIETLVISSSLDSEAQKLGWIIPVPAVPRTLEKESPGALKTLNHGIQPKITHDLLPLVINTIVVVFVGNLLVGTMLFAKKQLLNVFFSLVLIVMFSTCLLPAGINPGAEAPTKAANVKVEKTVAVGSYDVSVLRLAKPDALNAWLDENGFSSLPTAAETIVADYIAKGWVFAAIKLTREESGVNAPHPIKMVFDAKQAVYPMQLTAIAGGCPAFEIFVIGSGSASCAMLPEEFSDRFIKGETDELFDNEAGPPFFGTTSRLRIGHPGVCRLMWNDCVLTKFAGNIDSHDMTKDIDFAWGTFKTYRQHFYTEKGAWSFALILFISFTGGWCLISMLVCEKKIKQPGGFGRYITKVLLPAVVLLAVGAGVVFAVVPKLKTTEVSVSRGFRWPYAYPFVLQESIEEELDEFPNVLQGTDQEIAAWLLESLPKLETIGGAKLKIEDSPGNFTVEKRSDKVLVRVYDHSGSVLLIERPVPDSSRGDDKPIQKEPKPEPAISR